MNFVKFNSKKVKDLSLSSKYNIVLNNGRQITNVQLTLKNDSYFFACSLGAFALDEVSKIAPYIEFSYVSVGDGFVITKNGSKVFRENHHGIIDDEQIVKHFIHYMNQNANTYTPDNIKQNDVVKCIDKHFHLGEKAIVTNIVKPDTLEDHGMVEVFLLSKEYFEHFTYTGWNDFFEIIEEY